MKTLSWLTILYLLLASFVVGQDITEDSNWFREIGRDDDYYTRFDFARYTKDDVRKAKQRFVEISSNNTSCDWCGIYSRGVESGSNELHWNASGGFVYFYVYHTLGALDHGSVFENADSVIMHTEKSAKETSQKFLNDPLIKVTFGEARFLVPEKRLSDFLERAVGLNTDITDYGYYWQKDAQKEPKIFGRPNVPEKYSHLVRTPIKSTITAVGRRVIHQDRFDDGTLNYEEVYRYVTLGAGRRNGVKIGMNFFVDQLNEWVEVTNVRKNSSVGRIRRSLYEGKEECLDSEHGQGMQTPCKTVRVGLIAQTKLSELYF